MQGRQKRREFLKITGGAALLGSLAGCTGDSSESGSGDGSDSGSGVGSGSGSGGGSGSGDFPTEPITILHPYSPGGGYYFYSTLLAELWTQSDQVPVDVSVQNVEGGGGRIATEQMYRAEPDGYTLEVVNIPAFSMLQVAEDVQYDMTKLTYLGHVADSKVALGVGADTDIETLDDYVSGVNSGDVKFATPGMTSDGTIGPVTLGAFSGLYSTDRAVNSMIPFEGTPESIAAINRGEAQVYAAGVNTIAQYVESGDLRPFMYLTMDDAPPDQISGAETLQTANVENGDQIAAVNRTLRGFAGPPEIPDNRATFLRDAFDRAVQSDEYNSKASEANRPVHYGDAETAQQKAIDQVEAWTENKEVLETVLGQN